MITNLGQMEEACSQEYHQIKIYRNRSHSLVIINSITRNPTLPQSKHLMNNKSILIHQINVFLSNLLIPPSISPIFHAENTHTRIRYLPSQYQPIPPNPKVLFTYSFSRNIFSSNIPNNHHRSYLSLRTNRIPKLPFR